MRPVKRDKPKKTTRTKVSDLQHDVANEQRAANTRPGKYVAAGIRSAGMYGDEDKPEIKISNLPQWCDFAHVKHLVDTFRRNVLGHNYINKYKIRMIPSKKTLETWHADPKLYAHRLAEYERLSIVQFDEESDVQKAIEVLDGHQYSNHILRVEKAKPRRQ